MSLSNSILKDRATLTAPAHDSSTLEDGMPTYETQAEDVPCWVIPEMSGSFGGIMGRIPTGRWQAMFQPDVTIAEEWRVTVSDTTYEVVQVLNFGTHLEAVLNRLNIAFTPDPLT